MKDLATTILNNCSQAYYDKISTMSGDELLQYNKTVMGLTTKTITGRQIKIRPNHSQRTFTIVTESGKYRTTPMSKSDFNNADYWTGNDWQQFLRTDDYTTVKK